MTLNIERTDGYYIYIQRHPFDEYIRESKLISPIFRQTGNKFVYVRYSSNFPMICVFYTMNSISLFVREYSIFQLDYTRTIYGRNTRWSNYCQISISAKSFSMAFPSATTIRINTFK